MASEPQVETLQQLADEVVAKIEGYLDGSLSAEEVSTWARPFFDRQWTNSSSEIILAAAIETLACAGADDGYLNDELRDFRSYLLGERDYVVHHRWIVRKA